MTSTLPERDLSRTLLRDMLRIRRFEEKCSELYGAGKIRGFLHLYIGEEAAAVGALHALEPGDPVLATYREHGHALVRGVGADSIMAEMFGKVGGCSGGRGGSMHLFCTQAELYGGNAIVGGGLPLAVGIALADRMQRRRRVTAVFFGEGAMAEGAAHESLNLAALWNVPVLFVCENNLYAMGTALARSQAQKDMCVIARAHLVAAEHVDGMDAAAVLEATRRAAAFVREGRGPYFLELQTYRFRAHSAFDAELYRDRKEVELWRKRDPIPALTRRLLDAGMVDDAWLAALESDVAQEVAGAVDFAEAAPWEDPANLTRFTYAEAR